MFCICRVAVYFTFAIRRLRSCSASSEEPARRLSPQPGAGARDTEFEMKESHTWRRKS